MAEPTPLTPVANLGASYIQGLGLTYVSTTQITVAQGQCRDSLNVNDIVLARPPQNNGTAITTAFTLDTSVSGAGGLDTGTLTATKIYYVYAIASSQNSKIDLPPSTLTSLAVPPFTTPSTTDPVVQSAYYVQANVLMSLSATAPTLPFGFDMFRRIGAISIDGSSHIIKFVQTGLGNNRTHWYDAGIAPGSAATGGSATYVTIGTISNLVPAIVEEVIVNCSLTPNTAGNVLKLQPSGGTGAYAETSAVVTTKAQFAQLRCPSGISASVSVINYETSEASDAVTFLVQGYVDAL